MSEVGQVYFEFHVIGAQVKVSAICAKTGVEVSTFGPANTPQEHLKAIALGKLKRRLQSASRS